MFQFSFRIQGVEDVFKERKLSLIDQGYVWIYLLDIIITVFITTSNILAHSRQIIFGLVILVDEENRKNIKIRTAVERTQ